MRAGKEIGRLPLKRRARRCSWTMNTLAQQKYSVVLLKRKKKPGCATRMLLQTSKSQLPEAMTTISQMREVVPSRGEAEAPLARAAEKTVDTSRRISASTKSVAVGKATAAGGGKRLAAIGGAIALVAVALLALVLLIKPGVRTPCLRAHPPRAR